MHGYMSADCANMPPQSSTAVKIAALRCQVGASCGGWDGWGGRLQEIGISALWRMAAVSIASVYTGRNAAIHSEVQRQLLRTLR